MPQRKIILTAALILYIGTMSAQEDLARLESRGGGGHTRGGGSSSQGSKTGAHSSYDHDSGHNYDMEKKWHSHENQHSHHDHDNGDHHHKHDSNYISPWNTWNYWDDEWYEPEPYYPPYLEPRTYEPANPYPSTYLYAPDFRFNPDIPMPRENIPVITINPEDTIIKINKKITMKVSIDHGTPPFTVYWNIDGDKEWIKGQGTFSFQAKQTGVLTVTVIVKDAEGRISSPQKTEILIID